MQCISWKDLRLRQALVVIEKGATPFASTHSQAGRTAPGRGESLGFAALSLFGWC
jgi:hypothetical protein